MKKVVLVGDGEVGSELQVRVINGEATREAGLRRRGKAAEEAHARKHTQPHSRLALGVRLHFRLIPSGAGGAAQGDEFLLTRKQELQRWPER